jgi:hypothetical protein
VAVARGGRGRGWTNEVPSGAARVPPGEMGGLGCFLRSLGSWRGRWRMRGGLYRW